MVVIPDRDVEERHYSIANVLVDEGAVLHQRVGRTTQEGVDNFVSSLGPELVRQLGEVTEIGEQHGQVDEAALFGVGIAAAADIRVAGAAPNAEDAKERTQRPGQRRAAN